MTTVHFMSNISLFSSLFLSILTILLQIMKYKNNLVFKLIQAFV